MSVFFAVLALAGLGCAWYFRRQARADRERLEELSRQIEHFLLYAEDPLPETLEEGTLANLTNQLSRLEQLLLHRGEQEKRREEQVTHFVENMAHQMKNALTALQIQLDLLALHLSPEEQTALEKSQACMERLTGETDRILRSSQLAAGKIAMEYEPLRLEEEVRACADRLRPLWEAKEVSIAVKGEARVSGDGFWLSQAIENLLKNAVEHTERGTEITAAVSVENGRAVLRVEDRGRGIPPEELSQLFTRFHRGSVTKAGYGVGLSMARDIARAHHGSLAAGNRPCGGAWFELALPLLEGPGVYPE